MPNSSACKINETVRERYRNVLPTASLDVVRCLLDRFRDAEVCAMALENPSQDVKDYAIECLREMAADGDPFSQALLEKREIPYSNPYGAVPIICLARTTPHRLTQLVRPGG